MDSKTLSIDFLGSNLEIVIITGNESFKFFLANSISLSSISFLKSIPGFIT